MRKMYWDYQSQFEQIVDSLDMEKEQLSTLFEAELFITGCRMADPTMDIAQAWSMMAGHDSPVIAASACLDIVHRMRILFQNIRSRRRVDKLIQNYVQLPKSLRLYYLNEDDLWVESSSKRIKKRLSYYEQLLNKPVEFKESERNFAKAGEFHYYRNTREGNPITYTGKIPFLPDNIEILPTYRVKKELSYNLDEQKQSSSIAFQEVSAALERPNVKYQLHSLQSPPSKVFKYEGIQHLVGGLGAGKSTLMLQETVRLVKEHRARIGFVENSIPQVLKRVQELRQEGINAVPVIGRSGRKKHLDIFMASRNHRIEKVADWASHEHTEIKHLSDFCFIQALAEDDTQNGDFPCKRIKQEEGTNCLCPYASQCGVYRDFSALNNADVWVATSASVLRTRFPIMIDKNERTIYEAMYDLLDVIFVDEADEVQKQFDSAFLTDYPLFGDRDHLFEKVYLESLQRTVGRYGQFAGDRVLQEWIDVLSMLEQTIRSGVYHKLYHSPEFSRHLRGKMVRLSTLSYNLAEWFGDTEQHQKRILKDLSSYAEDPINHPFAIYRLELLETKDNHEQLKILNKLVKKWGSSGNKTRKKYRYDWLAFYLLLGLIDHCLKEFMELYPIIPSKIGVLPNADVLMNMHRDFNPFLQEALTGPLTGFHYDVKDGQRTGAFKVAQYTGVGRYLLKEWYRLYQHADNEKGPAVVLLSGTSLAPESAHYNLDIPVNWLLESEWTQPKVNQEYFPLYESDDDMSEIGISGSDIENRSRKLEKLTSKLFTKIEWELSEWRRKGTNRKVLLIVNSYEDVNDVHRAFQNRSDWKNRYRKLNRDPTSNIQEDYSRAELEQFYDEGVDVLIAPMLSINRGYNILDESNSSLFGSVFFLVRPYPIPHDLSYLIQILHAKIPDYYIAIHKKKLSYEKALKKLRSESNKLFHQLYHKPDFWTILTPTERKTIGWYTFVPVWQTIGRLLRNGTDAKVFYCDAKFLARPNDQEDQSMLEIWESMLEEHKDNREMQSLYGPFMNNPIRNIKGV